MASIVTSPIAGALPPGSRVLLAGAGGGYDVLGAVPLLVELEALGHEVHLGSVTFSDPKLLDGSVEEAQGCFVVHPDGAAEDIYCPEAWLARWLTRRAGATRVVRAWEKTGAAPLRDHLAALREGLHLDAVVLVDGGIDAILRGDETVLGTPEEDLVSLAAARNAGIAHRFMACVGFGAELRDGIPHAQVLERIAELAAVGGYRGASALVPGTRAGDAYRQAVEYVFEHQMQVHRSHVQKIVLEAMAGGFGSSGPNVWLSPLLSLYWHFDLDAVADTHLFLDDLRDTRTIGEVTLLIEGLRHGIVSRERSAIPI